MAFFIVTAVETSNLTIFNHFFVREGKRSLSQFIGGWWGVLKNITDNAKSVSLL
jgi:hypothetical protein